MKKIISLYNDFEKNPWNHLTEFILARKSYPLLPKPASPFCTTLKHTLNSLFDSKVSGNDFHNIVDGIIKTNSYTNKYIHSSSLFLTPQK